MSGFYMEYNTGLKWVKGTLIQSGNLATEILIDKNSILKIVHF